MREKREADQDWERQLKLKNVPRRIVFVDVTLGGYEKEWDVAVAAVGASRLS